MIAATFADWSLETWPFADAPRHRPILSGPGLLDASVDDCGQLIVRGWSRVDTAVAVPLTAISALMAAHEEWVKEQERT